jgi:HlyD family secretion protein
VKRRYLVWAGIVVVVAAILWAALSPTALEIEVATVARGPLRVTIAEEGETRLKRRFVVSAPVSGKVLRIESRPGDRVKAGQTLAVIQPAPPTPLDVRSEATAEARVRAADAAVQRARAERARLAVERKQAEIDAARAKQLLDTGYGAKDTYEQLLARTQSLAQAEQAAESTIRAAEFELAAAKAALISRGEASAGREVRVSAPIDGLILRRAQESEAVVMPGTPLLEIGTLDDLEIVSDLLSTDAVKVEPGAPVIIDRWGGPGTLAGRVQRVEPSGFLKVSALGVEEQRVNVIIDFVDPRDRRASLGDGYRVEVRIVIWERQDVLTTPVSSLFRINGEWAVFVVDGDVARRRTVQIGQRNEEAAEVLGGLTAGETVVAYPGESLTDGAKVKPRAKPAG